jgi:nitrogen fixation NifU-like protein
MFLNIPLQKTGKPVVAPGRVAVAPKGVVRVEGIMKKNENNQTDQDIPSAELEELKGPVIFYNDTVMDHFSNPRNVDEMGEGSYDGFSLFGDSECGDQMKLWIKVVKDKIVDIKFKCFGCQGAIATSSMATVLARGRSIKEAKRLTDDDVVEALEGIPDHKKHCSLMGIGALHIAINDYEKTKCQKK